jgi:hypothetical protein
VDLGEVMREAAIQVSKCSLHEKLERLQLPFVWEGIPPGPFCYDSAALGKDAASGTSRSSKYE